jgi:hypothetical protein
MMNYTFDIDYRLLVTNDSDEDSTVYRNYVLSLVLFLAIWIDSTSSPYLAGVI